MRAAYAAMFSSAGDFSIFFVARGERYQRLKQGHLVVNNTQEKRGEGSERGDFAAPRWHRDPVPNSG